MEKEYKKNWLCCLGIHKYRADVIMHGDFPELIMNRCTHCGYIL